MLEQGPDFWCWFDTTQFSYIPLCSPNTFKYVFNPNVTTFLVPRVCTLVLSLLIVTKLVHVYINIHWHGFNGQLPVSFSLPNSSHLSLGKYAVELKFN